jgi:hypothetical protein
MSPGKKFLVFCAAVAFAQLAWVAVMIFLVVKTIQWTGLLQ